MYRVVCRYAVALAMMLVRDAGSVEAFFVTHGFWLKGWAVVCTRDEDSQQLFRVKWFVRFKQGLSVKNRQERE